MKKTRSNRATFKSAPLRQPIASSAASSSKVEVVNYRSKQMATPVITPRNTSKKPRLDFEEAFREQDSEGQEFEHESFPTAPPNLQGLSLLENDGILDEGDDLDMNHTAARLDDGETFSDDDPEEVPENVPPPSNIPESALLESYLKYFYLHHAPQHQSSTCCSHICETAEAQRKAPKESSDHAVHHEPKAVSAPYRCIDCFGNRMLCKACIVRDHWNLPYHRIEEWKPSEGCFARSTLKRLGYCLFLGHSGARCPHPDYNRPFVTVVHTNGQHDLPIAYCTCPSPLLGPSLATGISPALPLHLQLLSHGIFPATCVVPQTGFTMEGLKRFHIANLESTMSMSEYHKLMVRLTDAVQPHLVRNNYNNFRLVVRQYRVLKMVKRVGRLHVLDLKNGELVILCPACPRPGFNLDHGWEIHRWRKLLFTLFFSGDGNFHLPHLDNAAGHLLQESMIGDAGFWSPQKLFDKYIQDTNSLPEPHVPGECHTQAGSPASSVSSKRLAVTGVFGISCRHVLLLPNGTVDLHKGERFRYVDVAMACIILAALAQGLFSFCASYDIACKYSIHFVERLTSGETPLISKEKWKLVKYLLWLIGKFHLGGHRAECSKKFSFNFTRGVGRMSGELVETVWAALDYLKYQTQEMGPGPRKETISDHMNHWNWKKLISMSKLNFDNHRSGMVDSQVSAGRLGAIEERIPKDELKEMEIAYLARGGEQFLPDPTKINYPSRKSALKSLQDEDTLLRRATTGGSPSNSTSTATDFVDSALDIELLQIRYRNQLLDLKDSPSTARVKAASATKIRLRKLLDVHHRNLAVHAPLHATVSPQMDWEPHEDPITLPSTFVDDDERNRLGFASLAKVEEGLRLGHAYDALDRLRGALSSQSYLTRHSKGQHGYSLSTRAQDAISRAHATVKLWAKVYRKSYKALQSLGTTPEAMGTLQDLADSDLTMLSRWVEGEQYKAHGSLSKGPTVPLPWIWMTSQFASAESDSPGDERAVNWKAEAIRLEWVHAKAAHARWLEDVTVLREEQRRIVVSFARTSLNWRLRSAGHDDNLGSYASPVSRGWQAYCREQGSVYAKLARAAFANLQKMVIDNPELLQRLGSVVDELPE